MVFCFTCLFELLLKSRSFSDVIQAILYQGSSYLYRLDCIWVLLLRRSIECNYGWCSPSQCFIIRYLKEACFSVTDEGKEDCLWCYWIAIPESFQLLKVVFLFVAKICLYHITCHLRLLVFVLCNSPSLICSLQTRLFSKRPGPWIFSVSGRKGKQ